MAQRTQTTIEGKAKMKRTRRRLLLMFSCVLLGILGCRKDRASQETSAKAVDVGERKIQEAFRRISDWHFYHGDIVRYNDTISTLDGALIRLKDPTLRKRYVKQLAKIVFTYPLDATDPGHEVFYYPIDPNASGTRREQWHAFWIASGSAAARAWVIRDIELKWDIDLRRLRRIQDEMRKVEAYLAGNGNSAAFKGDRNGWVKYHKLVQGYYNGFVKELSRFINNILMTHTLSYEKWLVILSQLETIIGHEVEIKESILNLWEEKRKKEQSQMPGVTDRMSK